jgi:hypothetical protein
MTSIESMVCSTIDKDKFAGHRYDVKNADYLAVLNRSMSDSCAQ